VSSYLVLLLVAAGVTYVLTPLVRRGAIRAGAIRQVRDRDVHVVPIPLLGGLAMFGGLAAGIWVAGNLSPLHDVLAGSHLASGLLPAAGLIVIIGVADDRWGLNPISKAAGQAAAGAILVSTGTQLSWLPEPGRGTLIFTPNQFAALTILLVVATINAVNFVDGLDGLAAGIVGIAAVSFFIYYYALTHSLKISGEAGPALAAAALLAGICLGFLPHNFQPARIFMGDTGSMLLGLLLAYVPISSISALDPSSLLDYRGGAINRFPEVLPLLVPAAIMVVPYADLVLAVIRRTRAGKSPFAPDRLHLQHRLLAIGHSHRSSVLIMYLWAGLFSGTVVWLSIARTQAFIFAVTTLAAVLLLLLMTMPRLRWWQRRELRAAGGLAAAGRVRARQRAPHAGAPGQPRPAPAPLPSTAGPATASGARPEAANPLRGPADRSGPPAAWPGPPPAARWQNHAAGDGLRAPTAAPGDWQDHPAGPAEGWQGRAPRTGGWKDDAAIGPDGWQGRGALADDGRGGEALPGGWPDRDGLSGAGRRERSGRADWRHDQPGEADQWQARAAPADDLPGRAADWPGRTASAGG
jgi:UDP-GlcNAc:undecaprenyl-phosphate GlcNAc-1-phosphate transferase